jgi:hypothetical protein
MISGNDHLPCFMKLVMGIFPQTLVNMTDSAIRTMIKSSIC